MIICHHVQVKTLPFDFNTLMGQSNISFQSSSTKSRREGIVNSSKRRSVRQILFLGNNSGKNVSDPSKLTEEIKE